MRRVGDKGSVVLGSGRPLEAAIISRDYDASLSLRKVETVCQVNIHSVTSATVT